MTALIEALFEHDSEEMRRDQSGTPKAASGISSPSTVEVSDEMASAANELEGELTPQPSPAAEARLERTRMSDEAWMDRIVSESNLPVEAPEGYELNVSLMDELARVPPEGMKVARGDNAPPPPFFENVALTQAEPSTEDRKEVIIPERVYANGMAWEVGEIVGRGAFGEVHEVRHAGSPDQRPRLVKLMYLPPDARKRASLWNEVAVAMFTGDFVGSEILQDEQGETWAAIILERHAGENVERRHRRLKREIDRPMGEPPFDARPEAAFQTAAMLRTVVHTLRRMHAAGWTHRDIKPGNIIFNTHRGEEWLSRPIDFGIAKRIGHVRKAPGERFSGTPAYTLPEALRDHDEDLRARDYWGAMLTAALSMGLVALDSSSSIPDMVRRLETGRMFIAPDLDDQLEAAAFFQKHELKPAQEAFVRWLLDFLRPYDAIMIRQLHWRDQGIVKDVALSDGESVELIDDDKFVRELENHVRALGLQVGRTDVEEHLALLQEFPESIETV